MIHQAGLYIHIPFCDARCHYCDFVTFADRFDRVTPYLETLFREMKQYQGWLLRTIFIGGGTPSVLSPEQIKALFQHIEDNFHTKGLGEVTVEVNPESAAQEKLEAFLAAGVNRLSIGLQSTKNKILSDLGRLHSYERFVEVYRLARKVGFDNINVDLMYGLPGQNLEMWKDTLNEVIGLGPQHVSAYALKVEKGTKLDGEGFRVDDDLEADMYLTASELLTASGYEHYEISNFAKPGYEGRHNLLYWTNANTIGVGVSSTGYLYGKRIKNTPRLDRYIQSGREASSFEREEIELPAAEKQKEDLMLGLRLKSGVSLKQIEDLQDSTVEKFLQRGLATAIDGTFALTPHGWLLSNQLFQQFVS